MRITLLTQSDPFYLAENIDYLIAQLPNHSTIVSAVLFDVSPFGKRESFSAKIIRTFRIFGTWFFINYGSQYIMNRFRRRKSVEYVFERHHIPVIKLVNQVNHRESLASIKSFSPDLLISIAGNQIFKRPLIDLAPQGCLNLHSALLPKYRGLMPSFWVLKNGENETGVSVFFVDEGIDSGPILVQKRLIIEHAMSQAELILKTKKLGMIAIIEAIELINIGNYNLIENSDSEQTYFSFPTRKDIISFKKDGKRLI
jgi:methionyl-tRNA formyltransferase